MRLSRPFGLLSKYSILADSSNRRCGREQSFCDVQYSIYVCWGNHIKTVSSPPPLAVFKHLWIVVERVKSCTKPMIRSRQPGKLLQQNMAQTNDDGVVLMHSPLKPLQTDRGCDEQEQATASEAVEHIAQHRIPSWASRAKQCPLCCTLASSNLRRLIQGSTTGIS